MSDNTLVPQNNNDDIIIGILVESELDFLKVGAVFISSHGDMRTVTGIEYGLWNDNAANKEIIVTMVSERDYTSKHRLGDFIPSDNHRREYIWVKDGFDGLDKLHELMADPSALIPVDEQGEGSTSSTALVAPKSRAEIERIQRKTQLYKDRAEVVARYMQRKRNELVSIANKMERRLRYMSTVIELMETYLGVYEDIILIKDGEVSTYDEPIHIIQGIMWMDEEVGDVELRSYGQIGIDFNSIEVFDEWLIDDNWHKIVPYEKCIAALQPSRQMRQYFEKDPWANSRARHKNSHIYLVIRNGQRLYRVFTNLSYGNVLFPTLDTWGEVVVKVDEAESEESFLDAKKEEIRWRKRVALLQGLIDRTSILEPKPPEIDLFAETSYEQGHVILHRDYEQTYLPDGKLAYSEWKKDINSKIERGSRVVLSFLGWKREDYENRYALPYGVRLPDLPQAGVYVIEKVEERNNKHSTWNNGTWLKILYLPKDTIWDNETDDGWGGFRERKRRVGFWLRPSDEFLLHYDHISLEDVEFYISRRFERRNYQRILPTLYQIYRERVSETKQEAEFVKYICQMEELDEAAVWSAVQWWKFKNIYKRPLAKDDSKAWRMIKGRARRIMKGDLK